MRQAGHFHYAKPRRPPRTPCQIAGTAYHARRPDVGSERRAIRVLIVDDHQLTRAGLAAILAREPDLVVVGEASNGREAVDLARALEPDLVLMDIRMPDMDGLAA